MYRIKFISTLLLCFMALSAAAEISVTTSFKPPRIAMGDKSQYIVEIKETDSSQQPEVERITHLPIPQNGGLELTNGRTSTGRQTSILNGRAEYSVTQQLIIDAKAPRVGSYSIPAYVFQYKGETYRAPAATLEVVERPADAGPTTDELIFLKINTPDQLYVGQTTPIELKLYISENVRLTGLNSFDRNANGFTISELPENRETIENTKGRRYRVLTWPLTITPIQTGQQDLNFQFTVSASVPGHNNRRDPFGSRGFGGSIFDDFFGRSERFTVYTEPTQVDVLPLPTADQPASFTGAIGDFSMQVYTDREKTQTGEPIMLSIEVSGHGNFDRISGPSIPKSDDWRSYEPESSFQPHSESNTLRGSKRFDYVMIPQKAGTIEIPGVSFAYFEPGTKRYTELSSPPIQIAVSPSQQPIAPPASNTLVSTPGTEPLPLQKELSMEEALLTLDYRPQVTQRLNSAPLKDPRFWLFNATLALALFFICFRLRHQRRLSQDTTYANQHAAKQALRAATKAAQQASDSDQFYAQAQQAIRLAVTCQTQRNLRTANITELTSAMQDAGNAEETILQTREFFEAADVLRFAGNTARADLPTAKSQLERILKAL